MMRFLLTFLCVFFVFIQSQAQIDTTVVTSNLQDKQFDEVKDEQSRLSSITVSAGYVPKPKYNALKMSFSLDDVFLKRVGIYTSFEKGLDSDYFSNIYGLTYMVRKKIYLWGGIDLFTRYGLFEHLDCDIECIRKEFGVIFTPLKNIVIKGGWSFELGATVEIGLNLPI